MNTGEDVQGLRKVIDFTRLLSTSSGKSATIVWPSSDPKCVKKRRRQKGFGTTVEENAKIMGITYRVVTMDELR